MSINTKHKPAKNEVTSPKVQTDQYINSPDVSIHTHTQTPAQVYRYTTQNHTLPHAHLKAPEVYHYILPGDSLSHRSAGWRLPPPPAWNNDQHMFRISP